MATIGGPNIGTDGLILALDAGNSKSILSSVEVLVVAGGGGGSGNFYDDGGGGGGGGVIYSKSHSITPGSTITTTVGSGGVASTGGSGGSGGNSVFGNLTALGGGGGGSHRLPGVSGGSGGGGLGSFVGDNRNVDGGVATQPSSPSGGFGNKGGTGGLNGVVINGGGYPGSGGGGGAGEPGGFPTGTGSNQGGRGGDGISFTISGTATYYAGGGGGVRNGIGGLGGGGTASFGRGGSPAENGTPNTGGGGGGGRANAGETGVPGAGGSGIIIIRYPGSQRASGGTVTFLNGHTIHTFTNSGTFVPNGVPGTGTIWTDFSNNGNSGTLVNGVGYNSDNLGSLVFDGVNDYIYNPSFNYNDSSGRFSVLVWIYPTTVVTGNTYEAIVNKSDGSNHIFSTYLHTSNNAMRAWHFNTSGNNIEYTSTLIPSFNNWNLLGYVFDQSIGYTFYLKNSIIDSTQTVTNVITARTDSTSEYTVGRWRGGGYHYSGRMANVQIYNRALTSQEIQTNYNATKARFGL